MAVRKGAGSSTGTKLVIVESPAKAKTIGGYLGSGYVVEASIGHIRELPPNAAAVPAAYKGLPWARLGVDVDNDFEPLYVVSADRKQQVSKLKALVKQADEVYLATDEDREGEAIAWHLVEELKPKVPVKRMVFHEITPSAIAAAVADPREIDQQLVESQRTRQILDRLYGYEVSPVLWKKVLPRLSAGRVQSVATRMVVERERARMAFHTAEYWDVQGTFAPTAPKPGDPETFTATLVSLDDLRLATGRDFDSATGEAPSTVLHLDEAGARGLAARLEGREFTVQGVEEKPYRRRPYPPFMTSTLQQEGGRKFRWSAQTVMRVAQKLYENGFITYMRTDSTNLSTTALSAARSQARELYGDAYVPAEPRLYTRKVKNAQEAHEAIRPAGDTFRTPGQVANQLSSDEFRLYELIWQRTLASQMSDAVGTTVSIRIGGTSASNESVVFTTSGRTITFPGFLRAYVEETDEAAEKDDAEKRLPQLARGDGLDPREFEADGHSTSPPARYTEASLVKALEEMGVGRPSTYASILETIQNRGYVWTKGQAFVPTWTAFAVIGLLESYFGRLVDYGFTASVENDLDDIASGERSRVEWLHNFYFGSDNPPTSPVGSADSQRISAQGGLKRLIASRLEEIDARGVNSIAIAGTDAVVRVGRYGPYVQRGEGEDSQRASLPEDLAPDEVTPEKIEELLSAPSGDIALGTAEDGREITARTGRYGPYVSDGEKSASLFKTMALDTITLEDALRLLTLPRSLGALEGEEVTAQNGRYGPYIKKGTDSRSIESEDQLFTVTLDDAVALLAQPKQRGRRTAAAPPLKELGEDPISKKPMVVKDGALRPGCTSPTARRMPRYDVVTRSRSSPTSGRLSCWLIAGPGVRL